MKFWGVKVPSGKPPLVTCAYYVAEKICPVFEIVKDIKYNAKIETL
jgi:hypothetical protein